MTLAPNEREWYRRPESLLEEVDPRAHEKLNLVVSTLERDQAYRKRGQLLFAAMYGSNALLDFDTRGRSGIGSNLSLNVSRSLVDAVTSRVAAKAKPKLSYVTEGGDYAKQHNAKQLEQGVDGVFYREGFYTTGVASFRDTAVCGTTFTRIEPNIDEKRVTIERWKPWEVILDDGESLYGDDAWRNAFAVRYWDRARLAYKYREDDTARQGILRLDDGYDDSALFGQQSAAVRVRVQEGWHWPSGPEADDGRYVVAVKDRTLVDRTWDPRKEPWPFAMMRWSDAIAGTFYGQGLIELLSGMQAEVNKLVREIQLGHHLICGRWLVERGSKVVLAHINNDLAAVLQYTGTKPVFETPAIISPEVYQHLWALVTKMYELPGINQQTAAAQKPAGLDSGEAQRVYADQQTETLLEKGQRYEQYVQACGTLVTKSAKLLASKVVYKVRAMADDGFETIDWKTIEDPDACETRIAPTSSLPGTPSGKVNLAKDMLDIGEFDPADMLEMIGMPDQLQLTNRKQSSRKRVEKVVGEMLRNGTPYEPDMFFVLGEAAEIARQMLNEADTKDVPDDKLQLVRDFVVKAIKLKKDLEAAGNPLQPTPPPPAAPPGPPQGPPGQAAQPPPQAPPQQQAA